MIKFVDKMVSPLISLVLHAVIELRVISVIFLVSTLFASAMMSGR